MTGIFDAAVTATEARRDGSGSNLAPVAAPARLLEDDAAAAVVVVTTVEATLLVIAFVFELLDNAVDVDEDDNEFENEPESYLLPNIKTTRSSRKKFSAALLLFLKIAHSLVPSLSFSLPLFFVSLAKVFAWSRILMLCFKR